ncbi:MAG: ATP synthase F1 subunit delta [Bacteroidota bacterium]
MKHLRVAKRYAKALLAISLEKNLEDRVYKDMQVIFNAFKASPELRVLMKSPIVREGKKINILKSLFEKHVDPFTLHYLNIITRKNRAILLQAIAHEYAIVYGDFLGIQNVKVTTAMELDDKLMEKVLEVAKKITDKKILIEEYQDKSIIGGFVLNIGTYQYDASVKTKLMRMKKHFGY